MRLWDTIGEGRGVETRFYHMDIAKRGMIFCELLDNIAERGHRILHAHIYSEVHRQSVLNPCRVLGIRWYSP